MGLLCLSPFDKSAEVYIPPRANRACCQISVAQTTRSHPLFHLEFPQECRIGNYEQRFLVLEFTLSHS